MRKLILLMLLVASPAWARNDIRGDSFTSQPILFAQLSVACLSKQAPAGSCAPQTDGTAIFCADCALGTTVCTGGGTGAWAQHLNGQWNCGPSGSGGGGSTQRDLAYTFDGLPTAGGSETREITMVRNVALSGGATSQMTCLNSATSNAVFNITVVHLTSGVPGSCTPFRFTVLAGTYVGVLSNASFCILSLNPGDMLSISSPNSPDATLDHCGVTIGGSTF